MIDRVLIVDNYDSFTNNIAQILRNMDIHVDVYMNDALDYDTIRRLGHDAIIIAPGPGKATSLDDLGVSASILAFDRRPILGVCLGHQAIAAWAGGKLRHADTPVHGGISQISHQSPALFEGLPNPFPAVRYHSWIVDRDLPDAIEPLAWLEDGTIMALRHRQLPRWGVQFHPESICSEGGATIFRNFLKLAEDALRSPQESIPAGMGPGLHPPASIRPVPTLHARQLSGWLDPAALFAKRFGAASHAFWLDSARQTETARFAYMGSVEDGLASYSLAYSLSPATLTRTFADGRKETLRQNIYDFLEWELPVHPDLGRDLPFGFKGGFVGYFGYELNHEAAGIDPRQGQETADAAFLYIDRFLAFDLERRVVWAIALLPADQNSSVFDTWAQAHEAVLQQDGQDGGAAQRPDLSPSRPPFAVPTARQAPVRFTMRHSSDRYCDLIARCQEHIVSGESYELCLTQQFRCEEEVDAFHLYSTLRTHNPAPYGAFLHFGDTRILSSSPECFVRMDADGYSYSKPIKGTIRRGRDSEEDESLKATLSNSAKDFAENLMIVDLVRHDFGAVCETGSVSVPKLAHIESYQTVHQMVSTIAGQKRQDVHPARMIRTLFPGGSMVGAPKHRTMQILHEMEQGPRGVYSGALGYLSADGAVDLSIVIRTIVMTPAGITIGCGGAITILSDIEGEVDEMVLKARAPMSAIARCVTGNPDHFLLEERTERPARAALA